MKSTSYRSAIILFLFSLNLSAAWNEPSPRLKTLGNTFGADQRLAVTSNAYPWSALGYLENIGCSGPMVSKNLVLTAAHCVIDPATKKLRTDLNHFLPNMVNGSSAYQSQIVHVWWGTNDPDNYRADDWAIMLLKENLGDTVGWWGIFGNGDNYSTVSVAGYSGDFMEGRTAGAHFGCNVRSPVNTDFILHDCHTSRGSSGGPMFVMENNAAMIVGINVAEYRKGGEVSLHLPYYSDEYANIAVRVGRFLPTVKELRATYDARQ